MPLLLKGNTNECMLFILRDIFNNPVFYPDMTFIHEGNPNYIDKLVNFEKMVWSNSALLLTDFVIPLIVHVYSDFYRYIFSA